jgi:hypothetical protein
VETTIRHRREKTTRRGGEEGGRRKREGRRNGRGRSEMIEREETRGRSEGKSWKSIFSLFSLQINFHFKHSLNTHK